MNDNLYAPPTAELTDHNDGERYYKDPKYTKVGGWLLFFCISLTVLTPLVNIASIGQELAAIPKVHLQFPRMVIVIAIESILILGLIAFSIYTGIKLWAIKEGAIETAKVFLVTNFAAIAFVSILPFFGGLPDSANDEITKNAMSSVIRGAIFTWIWFSYLNKSVRVAQTFDLPQLI